jgi:hypothetical protein
LIHLGRSVSHPSASVRLIGRIRSGRLLRVNEFEHDSTAVAAAAPSLNSFTKIIPREEEPVPHQVEPSTHQAVDSATWVTLCRVTIESELSADMPAIAPMNGVTTVACPKAVPTAAILTPIVASVGDFDAKPGVFKAANQTATSRDLCQSQDSSHAHPMPSEPPLSEKKSGDNGGYPSITLVKGRNKETLNRPR